MQGTDSLLFCYFSDRFPFIKLSYTYVCFSYLFLTIFFITEEERKFKLFLEEFVGKSSHINRYQARFTKNKKTRELMGKTFITFYDKTIAENLIEDIEGEEYGNSILSADWAKARIVGRR